MSKTHWKKLYNPDYLGAYALEPGKDMAVTIASVKKEMVPGADGKKEECIVMHFSDNPKPMVVNVTNAKIIQKLLKSAYIEDWVGHRIQLFADNVKAFGDVVEALRVRPFPPKATESSKCADCGGEIGSAEKMSAAQVAAFTQRRYGRAVCAECAHKLEDKAAAPEKDSDKEEKGDAPDK